MARQQVNGTCGLRIFFWLAAIVVSLGMAREARAELTTGHFTLLPEMGVQEVYRSNIYLTESGRKSDFITIATPGLGLRYARGKNLFEVNYRVGFLNFARYSTNNYQDHRAGGVLRLVAPVGLEFTLDDRFTRSTLERAQLVTRQRPFHYNNLNARLGYAFADRWRAEARYTREDQAFDSSLDRYAEYSNNVYAGSLYYRFLPRVSGLVEYDYLIRNYVTSKTSNSSSNLAYLGLAFDPAGKLKGTLKAGYGWKSYDLHVPGRDNDPRSWIMGAELVDDFDSRTSLTVNVIRTFADDFDTGNASFVDTLSSAPLQHFFTGKIGGLAGVAYRVADYLDRQAEPGTGALKYRFDRIWTLQGGGFYNIRKWLQTRLEYQYQDKNSNFNEYSYIEHRVMLKLLFAL